MAKTSTTSRTGKPAAGPEGFEGAVCCALAFTLFLGSLGRRRQSEVEIGGFQGVFIVPQGRIVRGDGHGKSGRQRLVDQAGTLEFVDAREIRQRIKAEMRHESFGGSVSDRPPRRLAAATQADPAGLQ